MKAAYLKIVIAQGYDQKIKIFKKSYPEADEVSIEYYHNNRVNEATMDMKTFLDLLGPYTINDTDTMQCLCDNSSTGGGIHCPIHRKLKNE